MRLVPSNMFKPSSEKKNTDRSFVDPFYNQTIGGGGGQPPIPIHMLHQ